ncbi:tyrosine-type recombinase/integrase [Papillibacter cinnamivorans]|uniref:Site-specific recombinase XerD n=1 Tax=Papillibacter cinnamivorans DSM 12816 TaxID=1122930 RepID=A0A1W1YZU1_9FIRM|nr:tyrosine-type recombinase/integrase [Papillibacter cinnamivorans]SMC41341.1 Site-specific recombinase XerD [Papillibacter cinnamivorans DSM 12816]
MATARQRGKGYEIRVFLGYDVDGKKISRSIMWIPEPGMTPHQIVKELERQKILLDEKVKHGKVLGGNIRFAEFAERWFEDYAEKHCKKKTVSMYRELMKRITPAIGHIKLEKLQPQHLLSFYSNLEETGIRSDVKYKSIDGFGGILTEKGISKTILAQKAEVSIAVLDSCTTGKNVSEKSAKKIAIALNREINQLFVPVNKDKALSSKTILHYHRLISSILSTAVKWQVIYSNPCSRVDPPKLERKEAKYLDEVETRHLLELLECEPVQFKTIIKLLIYTGMRRGELCGLEWDDVKFDSHTIHIGRSSLYLPGSGIYEDTPKNESSNRVIKISSDAIAMLREYEKWQIEQRTKLGDQWVETRRLFTAWNGKPIHPDTVSGYFKKFIKKNNLPDISVHSLRHTNATLLIASGIPLSNVKSRLGHAQETTTRNIYNHAIKSMDAAAAEVLEDILSPSRTHEKE